MGKDRRRVFMTKIPCTDDFVQKSLCGERLPAERDQQRHLNVYVPEYGNTVESTHVVRLCKLGKIFYVNFEQQRCV